MAERPRRAGWLAAAPLLLAALPSLAAEVTVSGRDIRVDGRPFAVRGVAGNGPLAPLPGLGVTTVRSYGEDPGPLLDAAQGLGLKVIAGLWVGQPRQGADYADPAFRARQLAELEALVTRYRDHPALLMWGIGNEVEVDLADDSPVWPEIEAVAAMVRRVDLAHPTLAVLAETGSDKVAKLIAQAPSIQALGLNSYGDALYSAPARAREQGWQGPIVITELGALGQWQAARAPWGAPFEPTSTQKAIQLRRYLKALGEAQAGAIVFLWGQKQEVTPSWHSLLLADGRTLEAAEAMAEAWGGALPGANHAPRIVSLRVAGEPSAPFASWPADGEGTFTLDAVEPDGEPLDVRWYVMGESAARSVGGDAEAVPPLFPDAVRHAGPTGARVSGLPAGRYRLFVELRDGRGAAATANMPFEVR
ncbi:glycoside hydrolase family 2 TIM barrel-domain containing protein [Ancylobacter sp. TS-1]|uniref:glycoside hydrolase family 2 TIM barrel-domain containing protein n=1 Tax=Ancylobacter sp. TS-1 TaxID=1850374 RepID=UPI001265B8F0|nr:glycoside hydrolase family 2 TIM barrel-domain containing protein [Ancylobacter sp. TS-1]QFR34614.1 glycosyl hydrolase [Ancylobacter sp. TS-1]